MLDSNPSKYSRFRIEKELKRLKESAGATLKNISKITKSKYPLEAFQMLKFYQVGHDPLDPSKKLNLIEQLNQTFTYQASFLAARYIYKHHKFKGSIILNLGTESGTDLKTEDGTIVAEVFATTHIRNNDKLNKDIKRIKRVRGAKHRYVFFIAPMIPKGPYDYKPKSFDLAGVKIISLLKFKESVSYPFATKN